MLDPEAFVVKGGIVALATLSVIRFILREFNSLKSEFRRGRKRRGNSRTRWVAHP